MPSQDFTRSLFVTGLRNAHAMENQALSIMKPQVARIENYPDVAARLTQHISETEGQIARLEEALSSLGETNSSLKDWALSATGAMAALGHTIAGDEILKNSFANFAFENFEIAAYTSLLTIGESVGLAAANSAISQNLAEEVAMAKWLEAHLADTTRRFVSLSESGSSAKV